MPYNILIVEDSASMRAFIASTLGALDDFKIFEVATGFEALRLLPRYKFNLILVDTNMPDINGLELLSFIKNNEEYKNIPVIIISTEGSEKDQKKGLSLGADEYLVKPFDPKSLQKLARMYLKIK